MNRRIIYAMSFLFAGAAASQLYAAASESYAQTLADRAVAEHKDIISLAIWGQADDRSPLKVVASHGAANTAAVDPNAASKTVTKQDGAYTVVELPLLDASRRHLGVLSVKYAKGGDGIKRATELRDALARHISHFKNLSDQAQVDPAVPTNSYAQHLVDMEMAKHPEIVIMALHAATPRNKAPAIIASNIGRIGKNADEDDMRVIEKGTENREVDETGIRFEAEIPLLDVSGTRIGAVGIVYDYKAGDDKDRLVSAARAVRDDLRRHISNPANLPEPYPYDASFSDRTLGQKIVLDMIARHPDVLILAFHVTPPGHKDNIIMASNIGRIGKKADEDDMRVINTGKPNLEVNENGIRFEVESVLKDQNGKDIGAVSVVLPYAKGDDKIALQKKADVISGEIAGQIPSAAALFQDKR